jgi:hypothetical protein
MGIGLGDLACCVRKLSTNRSLSEAARSLCICAGEGGPAVAGLNRFQKIRGTTKYLPFGFVHVPLSEVDDLDVSQWIGNGCDG